MIADFEIGTGITKTTLGERTFTTDIFAFWTHARTGVTEKIILEVRGYKGHNTKWANFKDRCRDLGHEQKKMKTVRVNMLDLVGRKKVDDDTIKADILWQLNR